MRFTDISDIVEKLQGAGFEQHPTGVWYTRQQAPGALPNGTRVVKVGFEDGDTHPLGARATVLGSIRVSAIVGTFYFVEWDDLPGVPVGVVDWKLA